MNEPIIRVERLGKRYRLGIREKPPETLRGAIASVFGAPFHYLRQMRRPPTEAETLWALKNVSFEVQRGEVVGLIGRNGAGKTTLLKILSRITDPTEGRAILHGRVGSLLEVGTGFHPDLTGRENVYMNGSILGMKRREIDRKFDEIVAFAEVEKFLDTPVKRYSSGMYVRLAFAVAAHLEPEVLIVDEVLAVGDAAFQRKCLGKMGAVAGEGRTVLFVSHNLGSIQSLCPRVLWMQAGQLRGEGEADRVIADYLDEVEWSAPEKSLIVSHDGSFEVTRVRLKNGTGKEISTIRSGSTLMVEVEYWAHQPLYKPYFWLGFSGPLGNLFAANMLLDGHRPDVLKGRGLLRLVVPELPLMPNQLYVIRLGALESNAVTPIFQKTDVAHFRVVGSARSIGLDAENAERFMPHAPSLLVPYTWELPDGQVIQMDALKIRSTRLKESALSS